MITRKSWILRLNYFSLLRNILILIIITSVSWKVLSFFPPPPDPSVSDDSNSQILLPTPVPVILPVNNGTPAPAVSANNIFIMDRGSDMVLLAKNADDQIYPASTTKMMTGIIAYENYPLDQVVTVQTAYPTGENICLQPGEKVTVDNLLYALLVQSANDAGEVLADAYPGGKTGFIQAMNDKAKALHLDHTHFLNPTGLDEDGHYSTASDLARLADYLLTKPYLAKVVATENAVIANSDNSSFRSLSNVNQLLGKVSGVLGVKTGFTDKAGESLVTLVNRNGHEVIISLLGSTDRFGDTKSLIDWVYSSFTWAAK
jgi:D-alanyl-D-alanine carboxypeptidase